jgi:WXG100 family type VII secretion target
MVKQVVSPKQLRDEATALREKATRFQTQLGVRQQAVLGLDWKGVAKDAFRDMFADASEMFTTAKTQIDGIATKLDGAAATVESSHQGAADAIRSRRNQA